MTAPQKQLNIVGVGASAGGLEAFETLFKRMSVNTDISFIVVQHLSPDNESILPDILQRYTEIPVSQVTETTTIEPNHIYVIPPKYDIGVKEDEIHLFEPSAPRGFRLPIDFLFRSLAEAHQSRAIGIVLSGTGSDGTLGVKAIKGAGGLTIAQDPDTTKFTGMPISAIGTRMIDHVVNVDQMPDILVHYFENYALIGSNESFARPDLTDRLQKILILVRDETGHDFSMYKPNTLVRRIERRMVVNRITELEDYIRYLRQTPLETHALFHDMLIGVTSFFRDMESFAVLKTQILPRLFEGKSGHEAIRIWVPACSTGEEAITLAILLQEIMHDLDEPNLNIQIFATDIDSTAIEKAREGIFPPNISLDMPIDYLQKYFVVQDDHTYRLHKSVRRLLVFAEQSIIKDPPFSNIDLVTCRNMLIYMSTDLQKTVLNIIHYALRDDGFLFLGGSESISVVNDLFSVIDQRHRIFQKVNVPSHFQPSSRLKQTNTFNTTLKTRADQGKQVRTVIENTLLKAYAPPSVIVDSDGRILYHQGDTSLFWSTQTGESSWNILHIARPELRAPLTVGVSHVLAEQSERIFKNLMIEIANTTIQVNLVLRPAAVPDKSQRLVVITFEPIQQQSTRLEDNIEIDMDENVVQRIQDLEDEVKLKNEYLQSTIQALEASNEELQSVNEEFQSANEELRSTNEELETSREELQAINEELLTMNAELNIKIEELDAVNNDQRNILQNINVGLLLLTDNMQVRVFNPIVADLFNLIETDIKRPITQLASNFQYDRLTEDIQRVVRTLRPTSTEIEADGTFYLMNIHPYRTEDGDVDGSILTFTDITARKQMEDTIRQDQEKLQRIVEVLPVGVSLLDHNRKIVDVNSALEQILELNLEDLQAGKYASRRYLNAEGAAMEAYEFPSNRAIAEQKQITNVEIGVVQEDGNLIWTSVSAAPLNLSSLSAVVVTVDITQQKRDEAQLLSKEQLLSNTVANYAAKSSMVRVRMPLKRANRCQIREIKSGSGVSGSIFIVSAR